MVQSEHAEFIMSKSLIMIPARLAATRLPNKPLLDIRGEPMIVHVLRRGLEAGLGPVVVACCSSEIARVVEKAGGHAVITEADLPSGTDRIFAAGEIFDPAHDYETIINLQGDLPFISPQTIQAVTKPFENPDVDMTTIAACMTLKEEIENPHIVKIAIAMPEGSQRGRALYFSRQPIPHQAPTYYHHIGVYGYRRSSLERFVSTPPTALERIEKLEQLRALELGMRIDVEIVQEVPQSIDTSCDLEKLR